MKQKLKINEISELLVLMLSLQGNGNRPAQADALQLGMKLHLSKIETLQAVQFMASRRWIDVTDLDERCCLVRLRMEGQRMLVEGGETGIL